MKEMMMMQPKPKLNLSFAFASGLIFAAICLLQPLSVRAQWTTPDANQNINNTNTGNVGIGTTSPGTSLDVSGNILNVGSEPGTNDRGNNTIKLARLAMPPYTTSNLRFALLGGATLSNANIVALGGEVGGMAAATQIDFFTAPSTNVDTGALRMTINGAGNVGIGTETPTERLEVTGNLKVTGNINVSGNINAKYQDVAEWVESSEVLAAGTVVVLDSRRPNQVIASTSAYDTRAAGVISLQPGIAMGEQAEGRVLVATTGRVRIKVDASNSSINIGDLLVTSHKTGLAMKSVPVEIGGLRLHRPGTLIGKALEPLRAGEGEILVLLSLQ